MRALEHSGPWTSLVTPDGRRGWVSLPELGSNPNEIVSFSGGMVAYYRGDYEQAARLFGEVAAMAGANANVKEDAACLRAAAESLGGRVELTSAPAQGTCLRVWVPPHST